MRITINIAPPTEAPIIMGSFDFGFSSLLSVVSVVEIKCWTLRMVAFTDEDADVVGRAGVTVFS